jgi:cell shape-determining protein MreC
MPVIYSVGIVGRIDRVGPGGAQVQLITDPKFGASARFCRFVGGKEQVLNTTQPFITGSGHGLMQIGNISLRETKGSVPGDPEAGVIAVGDYVVLDDPDWSLNLKGRILGQVSSITKQVSAPTTALIRVRPVLTLSTLRDVMVMNKAVSEDAARPASSSVGPQ